jgi:pimeloyl-ACP methyl ester carboxylesterase
LTQYQPRRPPRHETVDVRGLQIHLTRWGPEATRERPPVFLLHGFMDTSDTFQFLVDAFAADRPLVAPDWRGFGRSAWPRDGYWFPDYVADLDALLNLLTPQAPAQLVGHSMGGNVAGLYCGARPERVRCFVNLEGFGLPRMSFEKAPERMRQWLDQLSSVPELSSYDSFELLAEVIRKRYPRVPPPRALFIAKSWGGLAPDGRVRLKGDPRHKLVNPVLYRRDEAESFWRRIRAPLLMVCGELSEFAHRLGEDCSEEAFRRHIPQLRLVTIAAAGHMMHLERPEAVAPLIESFLQTT